ncbi:glycosyltransferase family 2 protein [Candidatus Gottesmanbacteria bacterium]|nr:glycosyltransferase family 2 protein [Candidatus Gottesmanbacteria bacterium]
MKISAIVIAKNEEARIERCLSSLEWVDEVIVVNNGSTDKTKNIADKKGATIIDTSVRDFAKLRNIAKEKANGEWLLYIDADETVSGKLAEAINRIIINKQSSVNGFILRRENYYLGHKWPGDEYILRLMRKDALIEWYGELHESARVKGQIGKLNAPIIHNTHRTLEEMVAKTNEWSESEARLRFDAGHPPISWWRLLRVMITGFWNSFVIQNGWKAGTTGWIESIYQSFSIFITYAKLWEKQNKK